MILVLEERQHPWFLVPLRGADKVHLSHVYQFARVIPRHLHLFCHKCFNAQNCSKLKIGTASDAAELQNCIHVTIKLALDAI